MSNVINFPGHDFRHWREIEADVRGFLAEQGAAVECINFVIEAMRGIHQRHMTGFQISAEADNLPVVREMERNFQQITTAMFTQLVLAYIRIWRLETGR